MAVVKRDACPLCSTADQLLYFYEPTERGPDDQLACPECIRARARVTNRTTACDSCGAPGAWRNPRTRRDEFFCPSCHVKTGEGVVQNPYAARTSPTHSKGVKPKCEITGDQLGCRGEVKPRTVAGASHLLCTRHAGKKSAAWAIEDGEA